MAVANYFEKVCDSSPDWETFRDALYDLLEGEFEDSDVEPQFDEPEVCFRVSPDDDEVFQVVLTSGMAIELRPQDGEEGGYQTVSSEEELGVASAIYNRLVRAIEIARPELKGDISLSEVPVINNGFLRDDDGDAFRGTFSLLSDSEKKFNYVVNVVDLEADELVAEVEPI